VHRADDVLRVAAALQQQRLAVAAHVRKEVYAALAADERLAVFRPPTERDEVADVRHHQLVADVAGSLVEQESRLPREDLGVEVGGHRQLRAARCEAGGVRKLGHCGQAPQAFGVKYAV
jgi:hypothetical protein